MQPERQREPFAGRAVREDYAPRCVFNFPTCKMGRPLNTSLPRFPRSNCSSCGVLLSQTEFGHQCRACTPVPVLVTCPVCGYKCLHGSPAHQDGHICPAPALPRAPKTCNGHNEENSTAEQCPGKEAE